jgi:hypothetical protein
VDVLFSEADARGAGASADAGAGASVAERAPPDEAAENPMVGALRVLLGSAATREARRSPAVRPVLKVPPRPGGGGRRSRRAGSEAGLARAVPSEARGAGRGATGR